MLVDPATIILKNTPKFNFVNANVGKLVIRNQNLCYWGEFRDFLAASLEMNSWSWQLHLVYKKLISPIYLDKFLTGWMSGRERYWGIRTYTKLSIMCSNINTQVLHRLAHWYTHLPQYMHMHEHTHTHTHTHIGTYTQSHTHKMNTPFGGFLSCSTIA